MRILILYLYLQLGLLLKKILKADDGLVSKSDFIEATSDYIDNRSNLQAATDVSKAYICIGNNEVVLNSVCRSPGRVEILTDLIQRHIEVKSPPPTYINFK